MMMTPPTVLPTSPYQQILTLIDYLSPSEQLQIMTHILNIIQPLLHDAVNNEGQSNVAREHDENMWTQVKTQPMQEDAQVSLTTNKPMDIHFDENLSLQTLLSPKHFEQESRFLLALKLFELEHISSGKAAELSNMSKSEFLFKVSMLGIPVVDFDEEQLEVEFRNV